MIMFGANTAFGSPAHTPVNNWQTKQSYFVFYLAKRQPRSQGLSSSRSLEREGKEVVQESVGETVSRISRVE